MATLTNERNESNQKSDENKDLQMDHASKAFYQLEALAIQETEGSDSSTASSTDLNAIEESDTFDASNDDSKSNYGDKLYSSVSSELDLPSEETLENMLKSSASPYLEESNHSLGEEDDDDMEEDLGRLAAAEEDVRMELEMLMSTGFHYGNNDSMNAGNNSNEDSPDDESTYTGHSNDHSESISNRSFLQDDDDYEMISHQDISNHNSKADDSIDISPTMTNEEYLNILKSRWQMQATEVGVHKFFLKDDQNSLRRCYTCPLLALNKENNSSESSTASPEKMSAQQTLFNSNFEYIQPMPSYFLRQIYAGLVLPEPKNNPRHGGKDINGLNMHLNYFMDPTEPLPVRTCGLRIRPDVLCGAVMDTIAHAVSERNGEIVKRQGGHMMAKVPGFWLQRKDRNYANNLNLNPNNDKKKKRKVWLPPFCFDAQLCTKKKSEADRGDHHFERILLIRVYAMNIDDHRYRNRHRASRDPSILHPTDVTDPEYGKENNEKVKEKGSDEQDILKQAAYIVHQMERVDEQVKQSRIHNTATAPMAGIGTNSPLPGITASKISAKKTHQPGVASKIGNILTSPIRILANSSNAANASNSKKDIPALASNHNYILENAFRFFTICVYELETRELSYTNLIGSQFGAFPALSTLDIHYCSQLRLICRESMIMNLLETASGLEQYARDMENNCVEFAKILAEGVIKDYGLETPLVPPFVPLNAYPLDFRAPEVECPPWGQKVKDALEKISSEIAMQSIENVLKHDATESSENTQNNDTTNLVQSTNGTSSSTSISNSGSQRAETAVKLVVNAFSKQFDEEQCARLGRKNMQVMDRMAKMQALKRETVIATRESYGKNRHATKAAENFHSMAAQAKLSEKRNSFRKATHDSGPSLEFLPTQQVPLLKCGILVGSATGTCYVTSQQILFVTQALSNFFGGGQYTLFNLADIEFLLVDNPKPSLIFKAPMNSLSVRMYKSNEQTERRNNLSWILRNTEEVFSFVPSLGARRFSRFIDMMKSIDTEDPETLKLTEKGGLIYLAGQSK